MKILEMQERVYERYQDPIEVPSADNHKTVRIFGTKEWFGTIESDHELVVGQKVMLNTEYYTGEIIITKKTVGGKIYHFVGLKKSKNSFI